MARKYFLDSIKAKWPGRQSLAADQYEVIVSDDSSNVTAEEMIRGQYPWAKWVKGPAANRNNGAKFARGEWLCFVDDDCLPEPSLLEAYRDAIREHPGMGAFEGRIYPSGEQISLAQTCPVNETGGYLISANFCIKKETFIKLGGFDERFSYPAMEDPELFLRIKKAGYETLFVRQASVAHPWRCGNALQEKLAHMRSTLLYLSIHPDEEERLNWIYQLKVLYRLIVLSTLPGVIKYKGAGLIQRMIWVVLEFGMVCIMAGRRMKALLKRWVK